MMRKLGQHFVISVQTFRSPHKEAQVHWMTPEAQSHRLLPTYNSQVFLSAYLFLFPYSRQSPPFTIYMTVFDKILQIILELFSSSFLLFVLFRWKFHLKLILESLDFFTILRIGKFLYTLWNQVRIIAAFLAF